MPLRSINPATSETLAVFDEHDAATVERKLRLAAEAFDRWRRTPMGERAGSLTRLAERLEAEKAELGRLMTLEMGKPIGAAIEEAAKCALACRYYAEHGERFLARETVRTDASESYVVYQPLGVVLAVMPWNLAGHPLRRAGRRPYRVRDRSRLGALSGMPPFGVSAAPRPLKGIQDNAGLSCTKRLHN